MGLFLVILVGGMGVFLFQYITLAPTWVMSSGSPHVYNNGNLGCGTVVDRAGNVLLDLEYQRKYSSDVTTRRSTLHWLGDRQGNISAPVISNYAADMSGYNVVNGVYDFSGLGGQMELTVSSRVQNVAMEALAGRKGTVAVYNYKTGEILCAVTGPTYDPDNLPDLTGESYEGVFLNRFTQSAYVPGSIFKVVTTAAALDCVPDILDKTFRCDGIYPYGEERVTCEKAHGTLDLKGALAHSCNCAFAQISELVGKKNMTAYVKKFGLTQSVHFDGITTAKGNYDVSNTAQVSFAWSCIGQYTDLINPCRFMTFMGSIAGGGVGAEPYIVSRVSSGGKQVYAAETKKTDRIVSAQVAKTLTQYLENNVKSIYGAGNFPGLTVCAKSGTSQLGGGKTSNAMFAGFVADEAYPLAFIVVVENGGYGANTCVPVISRVLAECKQVLDGE